MTGLWPSTLQVRHPVADDAQKVLALLHRCDIDAYGSADSELEDLLFEWQQIDLAQDAWLAQTPPGDLLGYAAVLSVRAGFHYDFYVDPVWPMPDLGTALLAQCAQRARAAAVAHAGNVPLKAETYIAHVNQRDVESVRQAGFELVEHHLQMRIELEDKPAPPSWPAGLTVRTFVPGEDDQATYELIEAAFTRPGREPRTFAEWAMWVRREDVLDPTLWFLAEAEGAPVGACLAFDYHGSGWIRQLGVLPAWRQRGLGSALLQHTFRAFWERAITTVALGVAGSNDDAFRLYERAGMERARQYDKYEKLLVAAEDV